MIAKNAMQFKAIVKKKAFELNPHSGDIANADIFLDFIRDLKSVELISD